jgi:hypothetical protein
VAWRFLEFLAQDEIILRFARIPVKVAESLAYQENDPFLKLAVEELRDYSTQMQQTPDRYKGA